MKSNTFFIDEDTFHQLSDDDYKEFLKNNPDFIDYNEEIKKRKSKENNLEPQKLEKKYTKIQKNTEVHSVEDFKCFLMITWLELYLPRYAMKNGFFEYSSSELTNKQKISELLDYYSNCGISNIEDIRKNSFKAFHH